jgi:carbon-monoxide dehydrogenase large subunit
MTAVMEPEVGRARLRKEDARLVTGRTLWTENVTLPGLLHLAILRSPVAHARLVRVDVSGALESPRSPERTSPTCRAACRAPGP